MHSNEQPTGNDVIDKILSKVKDEGAQRQIRDAAGKLPGVTIAGNIENFAFTMNGPITFPAPTPRRRRP
ncbi:hypothetical protein SAMN05216359_105314 [Roseateles sp. YR242]|uniref:hypothetical protein n=1 Tax=Roseateles sp. YR242 TaxID=1855305 RepID=UPI0008D71FBA|nr:hypothetical protein [Roseateles sp. YR242]SEL13233.1 hypothetical protein SAMN05216359_105314 [Roseateles sp. YR242]